MIIRRAIPSDHDNIRWLVDELIAARIASDEARMHGFHEHAYTCRPITREDLESDLYMIALADNGEVVGLVHGSLYDRRHYRLKQLGYVEELFVRDGYRGKGLAKELFIALEGEFQKLDKRKFSR